MFQAAKPRQIQRALKRKLVQKEGKKNEKSEIEELQRRIEEEKPPKGVTSRRIRILKEIIVIIIIFFTIVVFFASNP